MSLVLLLGAIDLACAATLATLALGYPLPQAQAPLALALAVKGGVFFGSTASRIDILCAAGMIALLWFSSPAIAVAIAAYLAVKGMSSFA